MFDPAIHHRRSIRLRTHDYAAGGVYYVTICAEERRRLFGVVVNGRMALNDMSEEKPISLPDSGAARLPAPARPRPEAQTAD